MPAQEKVMKRRVFVTISKVKRVIEFSVSYLEVLKAIGVLGIAAIQALK